MSSKNHQDVERAVTDFVRETSARKKGYLYTGDVPDEEKGVRRDMPSMARSLTHRVSRVI